MFGFNVFSMFQDFLPPICEKSKIKPHNNDKDIQRINRESLTGGEVLKLKGSALRIM